MFKSLLLTSALVTQSTLFNTCKASSHGAEEEASCISGLVLDKTAGFYVWSLKEDTSNRKTISPQKDPSNKAVSAETSLANTSSAEVSGPIITGPLTDTTEGALLLYFGPAQNPKNAKVLKLTSPQQMLDMSQRFLDLAFAEKDDLVLKLCTTCYESPEDRALGDIERFSFRSITAQSLVHIRLAEENKETASEHYEHIISLMNGYEQFFKGRQCNPTTQEKIETNFIDLCHFACKAYGHLSSLYDADSSITKETVYNTALKSIRYGEDFILRLKTLAKKVKDEKHTTLAKFLEAKQSLLPKMKNDLMVTYFSAYQYAYFDNNPHLYKAYRDKIEGLYSELKKSTEFRQSSMKIMDAIRLFERSHTSTSGAFARHKEVRAAESTVELIQLIESINESKIKSKIQLINDKWKNIMFQIKLDIKKAIAKRTIS
ncbi:MAG: hypothetical protein NWS47_04735 [Alphaproteobacteria bacterium]|nr:hypothetical protein [Alphaproteobacteria bacterium]